MKLLKIYFDHLTMFENGVFEIDLFTSDRVPSSDGSAFELARPFYTNSIVALAGINASGKTTALNLIELACRVVDGLPVRGGGLPSSMPTVFSGTATFRCLAWSEGRIFLLESELIVSDGIDGPSLGFAEEYVGAIPMRSLKKSMLSSWDTLFSLAEPLGRRSGLDSSWLSLAAPDVSIAAAVVARESGVRHSVRAVRDGGFRLVEQFEGLDDVLRVFDSGIEHLEVRDSGRAFVLTFAGREPLTLSEQGLAEVLSSGTVRGLGLIQRAMSVLRAGGYLLVDEIENHLNRQLVNVVIDLFAAPHTNPRGATIVFTTHYPQLLDHIHRKDNVFFLVRGENGGAQAVKYSDRVRRIENKKSEVFASNYVKGTAPRYTDVRALRMLVAKAAADE